MRALPLLLGAMACSATAPTRTPPARPIVQTSVAKTCPLDLDGASLAVKDTDLGVALELTSYGDVAELRRQVRLLGRMNDATVSHVEDVDGGARIVFPVALRGEVEAMARAMDAGACPTALPTSDDRVVTR
jgi:hypothetical protein